MPKQFEQYSLDDDTVICRECGEVMPYEDQSVHDCPALVEDQPDSRGVWQSDWLEDDWKLR